MWAAPFESGQAAPGVGRTLYYCPCPAIGEIPRGTETGPGPEGSDGLEQTGVVGGRRWTRKSVPSCVSPKQGIRMLRGGLRSDQVNRTDGRNGEVVRVWTTLARPTPSSVIEHPRPTMTRSGTRFWMVTQTVDPLCEPLAVSVTPEPGRQGPNAGSGVARRGHHGTIGTRRAGSRASDQVTGSIHEDFWVHAPEVRPDGP